MDRVSKAERELVRKMQRTTNYDRIISKTPEELAKHYSKLVGCPKNAVAYRGCAAAPECNASACWLDWLRQEADA